MTNLAIVMPAYDELPNLRKLLPSLSAISSSLEAATTVHVVVPDDAAEGQLQEIRDLGGHPVRRTPTNSFGDAIRSGIAACSPETDVVVFMDADGSHDPSTIPRLLAVADEADVVIASRYIHGGRSDNGVVLRTMSRSLNLAYSVVLGLKARDLSTNFKLFHYADIKDVPLTCTNFDVVEELLFRVRRAKGPSLRIIEIPDYFHERDEGETKRELGPFIASYLLTLVRLRVRG